jgi:peptide chain release factor 2
MAKDTIVNLIDNLQRQLADLSNRLMALRAPLQIERKQELLAEIELQSLEPGFWSDQTKASEQQKTRTSLEKVVKRFLDTGARVKDALELLPMVEEDEEAAFDLEKEVQLLESNVKSMEMERMLSGPNDAMNAILTVNVGQGGVDSQDFTEMLFRMYKRYAERHGFSVEVMDVQPGEAAGYKNATMLIEGEYAYGYLKAEIGVHRLVRISPFDSNARRHTSFASVWVLPEVDESFDVHIKPEDLRIDTFRSGGAGGQHVNKTESAVRITHLPTNTVVVCQSERSQIKNRSTAMKLLRAKLYDLEMKKRLREKDKMEAEKLEASFGSQIRNYVLAPYRLAKDLRTGMEIGNVDAVLDGDIQPFIDAYLLQQSEEHNAT